MVVLLPSQSSVDDDAWLSILAELDLEEHSLGLIDKERPFRRIGQFCSQRQILSLDLSDAFAASDSPEDLFLSVIDDPHFSPKGHSLAATVMASFISEKSELYRSPAIYSFRHGLAQFTRGNLRQAEQSLLLSVEQKSDWYAPYVALGDLYGSQERWEEAEQHYRQSLVRQPQSWEAYGRLGEILAAQGNRAGAIDAYHRCVGPCGHGGPTSRNYGPCTKRKAGCGRLR